MADLGPGAAKLDIGQVARVTVGVIQRNLVTFLVVSSILSGIPSLAFGILSATVEGAGPGSSGYGFTVFAGAVVALLTGTILQASLIQLTAADLNARKGSVRDGLSTGVRNMFPLIWLSTLYSMAAGLGALLLLVPGVIILLMWCVGAPVLVVERKSVTQSLSRSAALTKGSRWRILGLFVIYGVVAIVIQLVLTALVGGFTASPASTPMAIVGTTLIAILSNMIGATGAAVLYTELRRIKDGVGVSELASVFD